MLKQKGAKVMKTILTLITCFFIVVIACEADEGEGEDEEPYEPEPYVYEPYEPECDKSYESQAACSCPGYCDVSCNPGFFASCYCFEGWLPSECSCTKCI
jgi:hypothetical protein